MRGGGGREGEGAEGEEGGGGREDRKINLCSAIRGKCLAPFLKSIYMTFAL